MTSRMRWRLRWRLSILWALQWGITGAILTYLPLYFTQNGINERNQGLLMAVSAIGLWVAPFIVGQVCDRWMATEKYLAISHFFGGVTLLCIPFATRFYDPQTGENFTSLLVLLGLYAIAYLPTIPLASSLTFRHLPDPDEQFGNIRVWGTLGWVSSGLLLSLWLGRADAIDWAEARFPQWQAQVDGLRAAISWLPAPDSADCFRIAAMLSFALSSFCVFLPSTPPARSERGTVAPLETLRMFRDRTFSSLIAISFLLTIVVTFYSFAAPRLLESLGYQEDWIPAVMTIGQISEFPALLLLAFCLKRFGLKLTFAMGMAAWLVRYALFALGEPLSLVLAGIALHGVCHVFLIIVIQLYVDSQCRYDVRASAQNLFAFLTMGIAMPSGFLIAGELGDWCRLNSPQEANYRLFFSLPAAFILVLLIVYWRWFDLTGEWHSHDQAEESDESNDSTALQSSHGADAPEVASP